MKIRVFFAAAFAAGAMTIASHAEEAAVGAAGNAPSSLQTADAATAGGGFHDFMKKVLRAGGAGVQAKKAVVTEEDQTASIEKTAIESTSAKETGRPYHTIITRYAAQYGVPTQLAHAVIKIESNYRPSSRGRAGEIGLMQIKPSTARMMGYSGPAKHLYEPETNIKYGMKYLGEALKLGGGNTCTAILKYNAGHAAKRMNRTSSAYCEKVKRIMGAR